MLQLQLQVPAMTAPPHVATPKVPPSFLNELKVTSRELCRQGILTFFSEPLSIIIQMIGFLTDSFPKQVINDKRTFLTKNWPYVSAGSVTIAMGLNCSLGQHMPKNFTYGI